MKKSVVTLLVLSAITALILGLSERPPKAVETKACSFAKEGSYADLSAEVLCRRTCAP